MKRRNRNWNVIRQGLAEVREHQAGTIDTYEGKLTYLPFAHWHAEGCEATDTRFEPGRGFNNFRCPKCNLRFALFIHMDKAGKLRDWSVHRQFDYSLQAQKDQEMKFAARRPVLNSLGDALGEALVASKAKNLAGENMLLLHKTMEKLEKDLLGSHVFHACMREVPALLAEARA